MVFSSLPSYLDPSNWQQQNLSHHAGAGTANAISNSPQLPPQPPQQPPLQTHHVGGGGGPGVGSIRPGSMADRARLANVPMPEAALKCPRCESTNTKFCYFNNYSLSQPRHFCKTCRRYWTRGGALRNVPVGGGCRRNKRSKSGSSKSPCNSADSRSTASSNNTVSSISGTTIIPSTNMADILGLNNPQIPSIRFMAPLHHHQGEYSGSDIGLNYSGISEMNFHLGTNPSPTSQILGGSGLLWPGPSGVEPPPRLNQQFPFLAGLDASTSNLYQFEGGNSNVEMANLSEARKLMSDSQGGTTGISHVSPIKAEETPVELNLSRQVLGMSMSEETAVAVGSDHYNWGGGGAGGAWNTSDLFGLNSPNPTSHAL